VSTTARIVASIGGGFQVLGVALVFWEIWGIQRLVSKRTWTKAIADTVAAPSQELEQHAFHVRASVAFEAIARVRMG
jgi:hypothetical protein